MFSTTDAPAKPKGPIETTGVTANSISLAWKPPPDDGGAKIEKYIVEKRPKGASKWTKVPGVFKEPEATAKNLEEGEEYEFRVIAVNEHGESEPLVAEEAIKAKHPFGETILHCSLSFFAASTIAKQVEQLILVS